MRLYIRHPSDIPIECEPVHNANTPMLERLSNISLGGLAFHSHEALEPDSVMVIRIPLVDEAFQATGQVVWCIARQRGYEVGMKLLEQNEAFQVRMIEQLCYIEQYKQDVLQQQGRKLSGEEAAQEWVSKYAGDFPRIDQQEVTGA